MLRRILDEGLRPDVHVIFADTGKERNETYDFVPGTPPTGVRTRQWPGNNPLLTGP